MPTRAQLSRDAALRRLTRVNRSLAAAAVVGVGVITDVVANTASGHTSSTDTSAVSNATAGRSELPVAGRDSTAARRAAAARHRAAAAARRRANARHTQSDAAADPPAASSSSSQSSSPPAAASSSPVVVVSGGS